MAAVHAVLVLYAANTRDLLSNIYIYIVKSPKHAIRMANMFHVAGTLAGVVFSWVRNMLDSTKSVLMNVLCTLRLCLSTYH